jgi:hypothetical protein
MKILNLLLALMFMAFAFVQVNDPDPIIWIVIYGVMAVTCILAAFGLYFRKAMWVMLAALAAYSLFYIGGVKEWLMSEDKAALFDELAKMEHLYIEETREFLGLMICLITLVFHLVRSARRG